MPVHRVSRQPGDLETEYDARPSEADLRDQALKTLTVGGRRSGLAEVGIDSDDLIVRPPESHCMLAQGILSRGAFGVLENLAKRGLPNVEISSPFQVSRFDLLVCVRSHATSFETL
jgi:hypothetical protein